MTPFLIIYLGIVISAESPPSRPALTREIKLENLNLWRPPKRIFYRPRWRHYTFWPVTPSFFSIFAFNMNREKKWYSISPNFLIYSQIDHFPALWKTVPYSNRVMIITSFKKGQAKGGNFFVRGMMNDDCRPYGPN